MINLKFNKILKANGGTMHLDIDCKIKKGDFVTIYGPSGAGKTTLLRIIAGLIQPESGIIEVEGKSWFDANKSINLKPQLRSTGLVFQDYALFPNMTVRENINYALTDHTGDDTFVNVTDLMDLNDLLDRKPNTLSGGQQQRVALARSIVSMPEILMLDEPMSALDIEMRLKIQDYLLSAHKNFNLTIILVSHDVGEIFKLSNKVFMLKKGKIVNQGLPADIFVSKSNSGKFQFVGEVLDIAHEDVIYILTILIANNLVKVVADESIANDLNIGDKVMVSSKAFNPIIQKLV
jgi:molybdate transport system ATP-binding protein